MTSIENLTAEQAVILAGLVQRYGPIPEADLLRVLQAIREMTATA